MTLGDSLNGNRDTHRLGAEPMRRERNNWSQSTSEKRTNVRDDSISCKQSWPMNTSIGWFIIVVEYIGGYVTT
jgi:hypothetical protein